MADKCRSLGWIQDYRGKKHRYWISNEKQSVC